MVTNNNNFTMIQKQNLYFHSVYVNISLKYMMTSGTPSLSALRRGRVEYLINADIINHQGNSPWFGSVHSFTTNSMSCANTHVTISTYIPTIQTAGQ
jgi:hypothetical protein